MADRFAPKRLGHRCYNLLLGVLAYCLGPSGLYTGLKLCHQFNCVIRSVPVQFASES